MRSGAASNEANSTGASNLAIYTSLATYLILNLSLTLSNKSVLKAFPYPYLLTGLHAAASALGCALLGHWRRRRACLSKRNFWRLRAFSVLYTVNIAISNVSLNLTALPAHQLLRCAGVPIFTLLLSHTWYPFSLQPGSARGGKRYPAQTYACVVLLIIGVALATTSPPATSSSSSGPAAAASQTSTANNNDDDALSAISFTLTILGAFLAALKTVYTHTLQKPAPSASSSSSSLSPLKKTPGLSAFDLLAYLSPLALVQSLVLSFLSGELSALLSAPSISPLQHHSHADLLNNNINVNINDISKGTPASTGALPPTTIPPTPTTIPTALALTTNALLALTLNLSSLTTNHTVGALSMAVLGAMKQVLVLGFAVVWSHRVQEVTRVNLFGKFLFLLVVVVAVVDFGGV
ncbi:MAG: hypothetical protein M1819_002872 [Sarea resinae]|nr:MAG: hypothetical protein M1819_002872 [Sarea resinae]